MVTLRRVFSPATSNLTWSPVSQHALASVTVSSPSFSRGRPLFLSMLVRKRHLNCIITKIKQQLKYKAFLNQYDWGKESRNQRCLEYMFYFLFWCCFERQIILPVIKKNLIQVVQFLFVIKVRLVFLIPANWASIQRGGLESSVNCANMNTTHVCVLTVSKISYKHCCGNM